MWVIWYNANVLTWWNIENKKSLLFSCIRTVSGAVPFIAVHTNSEITFTFFQTTMAANSRIIGIYFYETYYYKKAYKFMLLYKYLMMKDKKSGFSNEIYLLFAFVIECSLHCQYYNK